MRRPVRLGLALAVIGLCVIGYSQVMRRFGHGTPPPMQAAGQWADAVTVDKSDRQLVLWRDGQAIRSYAVALGSDPSGDKQREGDGRTPEGTYLIDWRNDRSIAHLSLHISYPDATDRADAASRGVSPGGNVMIHGMMNGWGWIGGLHRLIDWTDGCIAVTDGEMREIWSLVPDGTPITISG